MSSSCVCTGQPGLTQSYLSNLPDGPTMLDTFGAGFSSEGFEARFVAAQRNDTRIAFEEGNKIRITKELALTVSKIKGRRESDEIVTPTRL